VFGAWDGGHVTNVTAGRRGRPNPSTILSVGIEVTRAKMADATTHSPELGERLERIESLLQTLLKRETKQDWYTTDELARAVGKAEFTVRQWCRQRRIHAQKRQSGRGSSLAWVISHEELLRYQREGLLPIGRD
jgi:hypothetical protein